MSIFPAGRVRRSWNVLQHLPRHARQLGGVHGDEERLVARQPLHRHLPVRLILEIEIGKRLPVGVLYAGCLPRSTRAKGSGAARSSPKHLFSCNLVVRRYLTSCPTNYLCPPASALCPLFPTGHDFVVVGDQNVARSHTGWQRWIGRGAFVVRRTLSQLPHPLKVFWYQHFDAPYLTARMVLARSAIPLARERLSPGQRS